MAFTIDGTNGFISKVANGGARPTLFNVDITLKGSAGEIGAAGSYFKFMCKGVSIPSANMGIATVNYFGRQIKYPGNRPVMEDLTTTIINDEGYRIRNQIENWMEKLNSHSQNIRDTAYVARTNYVADMTLYTYTKNGLSDQSWTFKNCFPISLDSVALSWDPTDTIMEFGVVWKYDYWTHDSKLNNVKVSS